MKCNLIIQTNEVTIRDYTLIEDSGIMSHVGVDILPGISSSYEEDEENSENQMIVIKGETLETLFKWLDFLALPVRIMT